MYWFYLSAGMATEIFILPANQIIFLDQFAVFCFCLEIYEATLSGFGDMSEAIKYRYFASKAPFGCYDNHIMCPFEQSI